LVAVSILAEISNIFFKVTRILTHLFYLIKWIYSFVR
jgi:hypothetical protein